MTRDLFLGTETGKTRRIPPSIRHRALKCLDSLDSARDTHDLTRRPGFAIHKLRGDLAGLYSMRVNTQWRIVFRSLPEGYVDVRLTDYH